MTYNAPLEMSANKGNGTRLKERLVGVPKEKVWTLPILKKNILKKYLKIASKYYIIYIEKRKKGNWKASLIRSNFGEIMYQKECPIDFESFDENGL